MELEIQKMLEKFAIWHALFHTKQFISNLFVIPTPLRPDTIISRWRRSDFFTTVDLKDAYFTIPVHPDHFKYLRSEWNSILCEFICLAFGLSSALRVFA